MKLRFTWPASHRIQRYLLYLLEIIVLVAIYFATARLGLSLGAVSRFATLVWLPSGIAITALLLFGYRLWPGILIGAFLINLFTGAPLFVAIGIGIGNTLEAITGTYLLKYTRFSYTLDHLREVLLLVLLVAPLSAIISATVGVSSLFLGKVIAFSAYYPTWGAWWIGDLISILILTPLLLTWSKWHFEKVSGRRMAEIILLTLFVLVIGAIDFLGLLHSDRGSYPITYLVFPPLIWAALRFGPRGTLSAIFALSTFAIIGTIRGLSPFSMSRLSEGLLLLQGFMAIIAVTSMILAAVMAERRELEQRKDEFITIASHELKTPLTIMLGYTELLQRKFARQDNEEALLYLSKITAQAEKLSGLIADLLDISKIQAGKIAFVEEAVDVDALVREVVEHLQQTTSQHQISIEGEARREIIGDRQRLGQALINLVTNAMKYSPHADSVIVRLTEAQDELTVSVQDFGIGIPKAHQEKVFERYYRVRDDRNRAYSGLGIGLYLAYQIIEHHGGRMWVESVDGQGSTFTFSLPFAGEA